MKINKANSNNSASLIIPQRALKELKWKIGDNCKMTIKDNKLIIEKQNEVSFS